MWKIIFIFTFFLIAFFHILYLGNIPRGLFYDESSVGYNAYLISKTGYDERQEFLPLYFKSYKGLGSLAVIDPLYVYTTAVLFYFANPSEFLLRFTSILYFFLFIFGLYLFVKEYFKNKRLITIYALLFAGFMPWFFCLSRIGFPVISQLPIFIFVLYFLYKTAYRNELYFPVIAGVLTGLWTYSYGTARLLAFFMLLSYIFIFYTKKNIRKFIYLVISFLTTLIPYFIYSFQNPGVLTARFKWLSYIYDPNLALGEKIILFLKNYFAYFSLNFLVFSGDPNYRHNIGGGEIYVSGFVLFLLCLVYFIRKNYNYFKENKFVVFLLPNLFFSIFPAALTEANHALRSIVFGVYITIFSCFGLLFLTDIKNKNIRRVAISVILLVLIFESAYFLKSYFFTYPEKSITAFEGFGFKEAISSAVSKNPDKIIVSNNPYGEYENLEFYKIILNYDNPIPISIYYPFAQENTCLIYFPKYENFQNPQFLSEKYKNSDKYYVKMRCF